MPSRVENLKPEQEGKLGYLQMVVEAIKMTDPKGTSVQKIKTFIVGKYHKDPDKVSQFMKNALKKGIQSKVLKRPKAQVEYGEKMIGKFKLGEIEALKDAQTDTKSKNSEVKNEKKNKDKPKQMKVKSISSGASAKNTVRKSQDKNKVAGKKMQRKIIVNSAKKKRKSSVAKSATPVKKIMKSAGRKVVKPRRKLISEDDLNLGLHEKYSVFESLSEEDDHAPRKPTAKTKTVASMKIAGKKANAQNGPNQKNATTEEESDGEDEDPRFAKISMKTKLPGSRKLPKDTEESSEDEEPLAQSTAATRTVQMSKATTKQLASTVAVHRKPLPATSTEESENEEEFQNDVNVNNSGTRVNSEDVTIPIQSANVTFTHENDEKEISEESPSPKGRKKPAVQKRAQRKGKR